MAEKSTVKSVTEIDTGGALPAGVVGDALFDELHAASAVTSTKTAEPAPRRLEKILIGFPPALLSGRLAPLQKEMSYEYRGSIPPCRETRWGAAFLRGRSSSDSGPAMARTAEHAGTR
jgi:hypothetical protein